MSGVWVKVYWNLSSVCKQAEIRCWPELRSQREPHIFLLSSWLVGRIQLLAVVGLRPWFFWLAVGWGPISGHRYVAAYFSWPTGQPVSLWCGRRLTTCHLMSVSPSHPLVASMRHTKQSQPCQPAESSVSLWAFVVVSYPAWAEWYNGLLQNALGRILQHHQLKYVRFEILGARRGSKI